ncbi:MAG: RNA 2',3'-cyclic phosphodiesterase [Patescibacteria group bacterium]|jgi:2'-5' RNA ligase
MKKRVFIAINLSEEVKTQLAEFLSLTKKINSNPVIRYVKTKGLHLTLHFLGYLTEEQISQVKEIIKNQAKNFAQTGLITEKIDAFPNLEKPRIIFLAARQTRGENLANLQLNLGRAIEKIGLELDHRLWHAHLTLARIVSPCQFKTKNLIVPKIEIPVKSIELMESQLLGSGAEYKILASYTLAPNT